MLFCRYTQYGLNTEKEAIKTYSDIIQYDIAHSGLIISSKHPWLAHSPGGIMKEIDGEKRPSKLLEIKCSLIGNCIFSWIFHNYSTTFLF